MDMWADRGLDSLSVSLKDILKGPTLSPYRI